MTLEQTFRQRWLSYQPLTEFIPAERLFLGLSLKQKPASPWCILSRQGSGIQSRSSDSTFRDVVLRFDLYTDCDDAGENYDDLKEIVERIRDRYDREDFFGGEGECICLFESAQNEMLESDGVWHVWIDFVATVAAGV